MSKNGVTTRIYLDRSERTHEYRTVRLNAEQWDWLSKIAKADSVGHQASCLCVACRLRREFEDDPNI